MNRTIQPNKIARIQVYQAFLTLHEGVYRWSGGKSVSKFDCTVVKIETDQGLTGYGEVTPLGPFYLPSYATGARTGIQFLSPHLIGLDPLNLNLINDTMDKNLKGHPYVKSAIDMACWDLLGKATSLPVCELLGGRMNESIPLYRAISQGTPEEMAANVSKYVDEGYRKFQLKVGGNPQVDIERIRLVRGLLDEKTKELLSLSSSSSSSSSPPPLHMPLMCDANTGWQRHEAMRVVNGVRDLGLDVYIEQPCASYEECLSVREHCSLPFILDESVDDIGVLVRMINDRAADMINLKISKVGGLSKARVMRDVAAAHGIPMNIEDTWGGDIVTAAIAHLAQSTLPSCLFCSTDFNSYGPVEIAKTTAKREGGQLKAPTSPGLGVEPIMENLSLQFEVC